MPDNTLNPLKRVLMIAFHFPPEGGSGTQRTLKFARYLPECGWEVEVLTVRPETYELLDHSLLHEVPASVQVHRTFCVDPARHLRVWGWYPGFLSFPDRYASWYPFGLRRGLRLLRERQFDVIYSSSPTRTAHLIACTLARMTGLPWVCDFRDPWRDGSATNDRRLRLRILDSLERLVAKQATHIIANTVPSGQTLINRLGSAIERKLTVLPNGYDEADFQGV